MSETCCICLDNIIDVSICSYCRLSPCNHIFHKDCIIQSLRKNGPRCPLCRGHDNNFINVSENNFDLNDIADEFVETSYSVNNPIYDIAGNEVSEYVNYV